MLASRHPAIGPDERAELYQEAWASVLSQRARGRKVDSVGGYLLGVADKLAAKRLHGADARRRTTFDPLDAPPAWAADGSESPEAMALAADEARRLRLLVEELDGRERDVLELRLDDGLGPREIRERLGLSERQYRRVAERAGRALLSQLAEVEGGRWARRQRSLLAACALGVASPRQHERARRLIESDPFCRALVGEMRRAGRRMAALLPPAEERPAGRLADLLSGAKQNLAGLSSRALDATPLAGARPGAAAAVVAGCLAAGGGAICAVEGVPEGLRPKGDEERAAKPRRAAEKLPPPRPAPVATPAPREPAPAPEPPVRSVSAPPPRPAPAAEFEPVAPRTAPPAPALRSSPEFSP